MADRDLVFYVTLDLKPECVEEWKASVIQVIDQMSREPAFVGCSMQQHAANPSCFTLYERWREPSVEAFVKNQFESKAYRTEYEERLPGWLNAPRSAAVLWHVDHWPRTGADPTREGRLERP